MKELICIVCPRGCHLQVDEANDYAVTGNACARGAAYGRTELLNPTRMLTSTVCIEGALHRRCPVQSNQPLPKDVILQAAQALNGVVLHAPVAQGQVVVKNICNTGCDIITTRAFSIA